MTLPRLIFKLLFRSLYQSRQRLNSAVIEKEKALTAKALAETRASQLESLRKNTAALAFGYGLLVVFCYCFFDIKFFPSGLSTGDVLFFLFAALGLGLMSLFCSALGMSLFVPASFFEESLPKTGVTPEDTRFGERLWFACPVAAVLTGAMANWHWLLLFVFWPVQIGIFVYISRRGNALREAQLRRADRMGAAAYAIIYLVVAPIVTYSCFVFGNPGVGILGVATVGGMAGMFGLSMLDEQTLSIPVDPVEREQHARRRVVVQVLFVVALLPGLIILSLRIGVFTQLGVRTVDVAISLDKANLALLQSAANSAGIALSVCRGEDGQATVAPIDVLWHASGARSLVHLGAGEGVDVELNTAGLRLVRGKVERCVEINESLLFTSGTAELLGGEKHVQETLTRELAPLLTEINRKWKIKSVKVVGHADPMPLPADGNDTLAKTRAQTVTRLLLGNSEFAKASGDALKPESISDGARHPIKQCDAKEPVTYQRTCNEVNRRVEIRFRLEKRPKDEQSDRAESAGAAASSPA
jgi:outer membrane protein OmpA-like peptidoglycan-associated protein